MSARMTPDELRELLGAYALGALGDDERRRVESALLDDPDAREELHRLEHATAWLGHASVRPSPGAWAVVQAEMERDRSEAPAPAPPRRAAPVWARRSAWRALGAAAALLVVAVALVAIVRSLGGDGRGPSVASPQAVVLRSGDGRLEVRAVVRDDGTARVDRSDLPVPGAGRTYQLWSITPGGPVSAGLLGPRPAGHAFRVAPGATALAITDEPAGGSRAPTSQPLVSGALDPA